MMSETCACGAAYTVNLVYEDNERKELDAWRERHAKVCPGQWRRRTVGPMPGLAQLDASMRFASEARDQAVIQKIVERIDPEPIHENIVCNATKEAAWGAHGTECPWAKWKQRELARQGQSPIFGSANG